MLHEVRTVDRVEAVQEGQEALMQIDERLHDELGLKRLTPLWAKLEIFIGLAAAMAGLIVALRPPELLADLAGWCAWLGGTLAVLGGYLALAGHRSHLYQSQNLLAAWLADQLDGGA